MKKLYILQLVGVLSLFGLLVVKNNYSYKSKTVLWKLVKSAIDSGFILLAAAYVPALLVSWAVMFMTRSIKSTGLRVTAAVLSGIAFNTLSGIALEVLCAFSVVTVDLITGEQGIWGNWKRPVPDEFMSWARGNERPGRASA